MTRVQRGAHHSINGLCSRIFPVVNVAQIERGLREVFAGCRAGIGKDRPRLYLMVNSISD